jgi:hypothetical protein
MDSIALHVEYLLRKHDCVVMPGFGALLCNYVPARFDENDESLITPPGRTLAFNSLLCESDGVLAMSVARRDAISYEAANRRVREEVEMLRHQLEVSGEVEFGRLGRFVLNKEQQIEFVANELANVNGAFFGLQPLHVMPLDAKAATETSTTPAETKTLHIAAVRAKSRHKIGTYAAGIAASFAVVITAALFLLRPIKVDKPLQTASLAPIPEPTEQVETSAATPAVSTTPVNEAKQMDDTQQSDEATVAQNAKSVESMSNIGTIAKPAEVVARFNENDSYCVIVASFPTKSQADTYLHEHSSGRLGILEKDSKFRVYAATASSYADATEQKKLTGQADAWVCHR